VVVGSYSDDDQGYDSGAAYVFRRNGTGWLEEQKLTPSDGPSGHWFGAQIDVDGDTAVVNARYDDDKGAYSGSDYVFRWNETTWAEEQKLTASDGVAHDHFGWGVAVDGDTVVVGARAGDGNAPDSGAAYVFRWNGATWVEEQKLTASDGASGDLFGDYISMDGEVLVISAMQDDDNGSNSGSAYVFRWNEAIWVEEQKLTASDGAPGDWFGWGVTIDGNAILVPAFLNDHVGTDSGAAYIFRWNGAAWVEEQKLVPSDAAPGDDFGLSSAISGDTAVVAAGDASAPGYRSGAAYVFRWNATAWVEEQKITASDGAPGDVFGYGMSLDGDTAAIGAPNQDAMGTDSGAVYIYELEGADQDDDGVPDVDDNCVLDSNLGQADTDLDGAGDVCDPDDDNDDVLDGDDNCSFNPNPNQYDLDMDGLGDVCDADPDGDGIGDDPGEVDNCPMTPNSYQDDTDGDGAGDACDEDDDNDGICDTAQAGASCTAGPDNCITVPNAGQADLDGDAIGDACDADLDGDGINNVIDNCPVHSNSAQDDTDFDGEGGACDEDDDDDGVLDGDDNCPLIANLDQGDSDGDGHGDACDDDLDGDGFANDVDNCPNVANSGQNDLDGDGLGDSCDPDIDGDGVLNAADLCAGTSPGEIVDPAHGCSIEQLAPCEGPRGTKVPWKNHGKYVSSLAHAAESFVEQGLITEEEKGSIVSGAAQAACGDKK
jgi:hypothetical protein